MVAAIEVYFDPAAQRRLRTLWTALDQAGVPTLGDHTHRRHRPHLSLAVADEFPPERTAAALSGLPLEMTVSFQFVGQFAGGVLWLGPVPTTRLLALHAEAVRRLDAAGIGIDAYYRPDAWVPHSTLSMVARRDAVAKAVPICTDVFPLEARLVCAAVVDHTRDLYTEIA